MTRDILKKEIEACLQNPEVLTKGETIELLEDCLVCFNQQEEKKAKFHSVYEGVMETAKARQAEAHSILEDVSQLANMFNEKK